MDHEERIVNEGELTILNVLESLSNMYYECIPKHISDLIKDLIIALENDVGIQSDDPRDYDNVVIIKRAYFVK